MAKKVIVAGLLGGVVLILWTFIINGMLGFQARIDMKQIAAEQDVYEVLKQHVVDPGRYTVNPPLDADRRFPANQPVFGVLYGGVGHEAAGGLMLVGLVVFLLAPLVGAWLLSQASTRVLSSFPRKVLFFVAIGFLFALLADMMSYGIAGYPAADAMLLGINHIAAWTVVGAVIAWRVKPDRAD
jgi:hypothetical protein